MLSAEFPERRERPLTICIAALGGQGGGVLSDWIVDLAEHGGHIAQSTSVPGVAQRTGATIYYVELFPAAAALAAGRTPVLALTPVPGDVDLVVASELMEAGRSISRGFITPDRTHLVASTHRVFAIGEKMAMYDGRADVGTIIQAIHARSRRAVLFDMDDVAERTGSVISSVLFGAVAAADVLPFDRSQFEDTIRRSGVAVESNLRGFAAGYDAAKQGAAVSVAPMALETPIAGLPAARAEALHPAVREVAGLGFARMIDYQDRAYGELYLDRVLEIQAADRESGGASGGYALTQAVARRLALWMSYEDTIRVADLKTRAERFRRLRREVRAAPGQIVTMVEFMHPRLEEVCDTVPAPIGRWIRRSRIAQGALAPFLKKGRKIHTGKLGGFLLLYALAGLRPLRRASLRYAEETARIEQWLEAVRGAAPANPDLALAIAEVQTLVRGYSDTFARGLSNYEQIMAALERFAGAPDAAAQVRMLVAAALADDEGRALALALDAPLAA